MSKSSYYTLQAVALLPIPITSLPPICIFDDDLFDYLNGDLTNQEIDEVERHLSKCMHCRERVARAHTNPWL